MGNTGRPAREMSAPEAAAAGLDAEFYLALRLKELYPQLRRGRPETVGGTECDVLNGTAPGRPAVRLYFAKDSGLLMRMVRFADIPQSLIDAVTSAEDKRFFHHWGFDYRRAFKAAYVDFKDGRKQQGASTLTMQLARAFFLDPGKSWRRKVDEILITIHLEHTLSKQQIFEDYANEVYFGRRGTYSVNGFGEAARVYFGKELRQIDVAEAALLAGLIQRPSYYNPFRYPARAIGRRNQILALMRRNGKVTQANYQAAIASPLTLAPPASGESEYSYFISMMNDELQGNFGESAKQSR